MMEHTQSGHNHTFCRRQFLRGLLAIGAGTLVSGYGARPTWAGEPEVESERDLQLDQLMTAASSSPGKQARLAGLSLAERDQLLAILSAPENSSKRYANHAIVRTGSWGIGRLPNYTTAIPADAPTGPGVCAACYGSEAVYHVDLMGNIRAFATGSGTNPLDVAYDRFRHRLIVASASEDARLVVIDLVRPGEVLRSMALAPLTGQGISQGGIQGVTVDVAGDYWLALAYFGIQDGGVLVKIDGHTLQPIQIVKRVGMNNPNGLVTGYGGQILFAMSDNGTVQEFDLGGSLLRVHQSVRYGYRGIVSNHTLWVCGWLSEGRMVRIDLHSGARREFPCVPLANSVVVDQNGLIWVAGDAGVSVSTFQGELLAQTSFGAFTNGLSVLNNAVYFVSYDQYLNEARSVRPLVYIPTVHHPMPVANQ